MSESVVIEAAAFIGWIRSATAPAWRQVVQAPDEDTAWARLLEFPTESGGCDRAVLPAGQVPRGQRRAFKRRLF